MIQTNFFPQPEKDKPIKIIQISPSGLQPKKVEELLPNVDILPDTYLIYPTGGYHPFYGVPNTFPRYQLPIWPYVKRIKYLHTWSEGQGRKKGTTNSNTLQINLLVRDGYLMISLQRSTYRTSYNSAKKKSGEVRKDVFIRFHRLVGLAWIPNPEKKKNVCHINDDRTDYLIENLKWGTASENMRGKIQRRPDTMEQKYLNCVDKGYIKG